MTGKEAWNAMLSGRRVARPEFKGWWYISDITGKLVIHLASGGEITEGDLTLTAVNMMADDWYVLEDDDTMLKGHDISKEFKQPDISFPDPVKKPEFFYTDCSYTYTCPSSLNDIPVRVSVPGDVVEHDKKLCNLKKEAN